MAVTALTAVPDARTLEAKGAVTKRVKANFVKGDDVCAIFALDE